MLKYSVWVQKKFRYGRPGGTRPPNVNLGPPNISEYTRARKLKLKTPFDIVKYSPLVQKFFPLRGLGPPKISETTRARMLKLKTELDIVKYSLWVQKFLRWGRPGDVGPPSVNLGPPNISESKRARKFKLKMPLDIVTYLPRVQKNFR